ncbi:hypothetical protein LTR28_000565 [Elasticomyces elasticus]|nr:hypothetical protein LTR28_000565 [Elasticomyces elasticus]
MRYHYIGAIINQLRYPCSHTHYFSGALLHLFTTGSEVVQEQILRVLLERMLTPKPQPWGLIVTILELAKNPDYNISELPWLKASPEPQIEPKPTGSTGSLSADALKWLDRVVKPFAHPHLERATMRWHGQILF